MKTTVLQLTDYSRFVCVFKHWVSINQRKVSTGHLVQNKWNAAERLVRSDPKTEADFNTEICTALSYLFEFILVSKERLWTVWKLLFWSSGGFKDLLARRITNQIMSFELKECNGILIFSVVSSRLEAVRIETRGERREFAKTLMAKGIVVEVTLTRDINVLIFIKLIRLPYFIKYRNISTSIGQLQNQYFFHMIFEFSVFVLFFFSAVLL